MNGGRGMHFLVVELYYVLFFPRCFKRKEGNGKEKKDGLEGWWERNKSGRKDSAQTSG